MQRYIGTEVQGCRGTEVQRCKGAEVWRCKVARVQRFGGARLQMRNGYRGAKDAEVPRWKGAKCAGVHGFKLPLIRGKIRNEDSPLTRGD